MKTLCFLLSLGIIVNGGVIGGGGFAFGGGGGFGGQGGGGSLSGESGRSSGEFLGAVGGHNFETLYESKEISGGGVGGSGGVSFSTSHGGGDVTRTSYSSKHDLKAPEVISERVVDVEVESPQAASAKKTVIERTVIPNYVEKTVQVPTYVEKTIRVPTYVEKTIKVPAAPTIVEKTISQEEVASTEKRIHHDEHRVETGSVADQVIIKHKVKQRPHKTVVYHKEIHNGGGYGYENDGYSGGRGYGYESGGYGGGGYGGGGFGGGYGSGGFGGYSFAGNGGGSILQGALDIPIKTLGAVKSLLGGLGGGISVGGGGGYASFRK